MGNALNVLIRGDPEDIPGELDPKNLLFKQIKKARDEMTGWERIKAVFDKDELGGIAPELQRCSEATLMAGFVGIMFGGIGRSRIAYVEFFRSNAHTAFETPLQAKAALQRQFTLGFCSGAFRVGWRLAAFTGLYMLSSTLISAYRGKVGIADQMAGGSIAGLLYKFREGPKATISGAVIGGALGLVASSISLAMIKLGGLSPEEVNMIYYQSLENRKAKSYAIQKAYRDDQNEDLISFHDTFMESQGTTLLDSDDEGKKPVTQVTLETKPVTPNVNNSQKLIDKDNGIDTKPISPKESNKI